MLHSLSAIHNRFETFHNKQVLYLIKRSQMEIIFNRISRNVRINRWAPALTTSDLISSVSSNLFTAMLNVKTPFYNIAFNQKKIKLQI